MNLKLLLVVGFALSFISILLLSARYFEMRSLEAIIRANDFSSDVVDNKFEQLRICKSPEGKLMLSEMRNRGKQLVFLQKTMRSTVSYAKFHAGIVLFLWCIAAVLFSLLFIIINKRDAN